MGAPSPAVFEKENRGLTWLYVASVFVITLAARWWLISEIGYEVPFWDQWYSDFSDVRRVAAGEFWSGVFEAHNEHRPVLTRLLNRILLLLDQQWDPLSQMYVAAIVHAAAAAALTWWLARKLPPLAGAPLATLIALLYALPHGWQNTVWGFQSQFSFLLLCSIVSLSALGSAAGLRDCRWSLGLIAGALATISMAAGIVTGLTVLLATAWECWRARTIIRPSIARGVAGLILVGFALLLRADAPHHAALQVRSVSQFSAIWLTALAWPNDARVWLFVLAIAPVLLVALRSTHKTQQPHPLTWTAIAAATWSMLQAAAFAFARGGAAATSFQTASRYHDVLSVLVAANALSLILLNASRANASWQRRFAMTALAVFWGLATLFGLWQQTILFRGGEWLSRKTHRDTPAQMLTALQHGAPDEIYDQLPGSYRVWFPPRQVRTVLQELSNTRWLPSILQPPAELEWDFQRDSLMQPREVSFDPPPALNPVWSSRDFDGTARVGSSRTEAFVVTRGTFAFFVRYGGNLESITLTLIDPGATDQTPIDFSKLPATKWNELRFRVEPGNYALEVDLRDSDGWIELTGPREMGPISYAVRGIADR